MKILITGGAGFIGSNFVRHFLEKHKNYYVVVFDKLTYAGTKENLKDVIKDVDFVNGDICNRNSVEKSAKECDFIVNFAAETHVDRSIADTMPFVNTNVLGTLTLLEAARKCGVKKFVQISTDEVYGSVEKGSFKETDKLNARNPYAATKAAGDLLALSYFETHKVPVVITRSTDNYGYYQYPEKFIAKIIIYSLLNRKIPVYGSGKSVRDWLFVLDGCEAIDLVLEKGKPGEIYNIAGKQEIVNIEVVRTILKKLGKAEDLIEYVKDRPGHDMRYSLDIEKLQRLGWKPKTNFNDGIGKTIEWFKENKWWWEPIVKKRQLDLHQNF